VYREALPASGPDLEYALPLSEQAAAGGAPPEGSLHGRKVLEPYPTLEPLQVRARGGGRLCYCLGGGRFNCCGPPSSRA
jgi:hypothetical protein